MAKPPSSAIRTVARNVSRLRKERGWSQEELADRSDIYFTAISRIERGIGNPTVRTVEALAAGLDVEIANLFT